MNVDLSPLPSVPANWIVCEPVPATENEIVNVEKLVLGGDTTLPICCPSSVTRIRCTLPEGLL
jgi:hypothetical protein